MSENKKSGLKVRLKRVSKEDRATILDGLPYHVGYGKPPQNKRFRPGLSGNPRGRQKGSENFDRVFMEESTALVEITEGGKRKKISKQRALSRHIVHKSLAGDLKAAALYFHVKYKLGQLTGGHVTVTPALDSRDLEVLRRFVEAFGPGEPPGVQDSGTQGSDDVSA